VSSASLSSSSCTTIAVESTDTNGTLLVDRDDNIRRVGVFVVAMDLLSHGLLLMVLYDGLMRS